LAAYIAHFRRHSLDGPQVGVLAQPRAKGLDPDSASESLLGILESLLTWSRWPEVDAFSVRAVGDSVTMALCGQDVALGEWQSRLTPRQRADWPPVDSREAFDALVEPTEAWSPICPFTRVKGYAVPDFGALDELFRDRALFNERATLVHLCPLRLSGPEFQAALTNLNALSQLAAFQAHATKLRALADRPLSHLVACAFLQPDPEGEADGLVFDPTTAFPTFPHDAFGQSLEPGPLRAKAAFWFSPTSLGHSESVMSRLSRVESKLEELGKGRYLAGNLRRAFGFRQLGEAEAATKARRIAESIAVRVLRKETNKRVSKPFADIVEDLAQMPRAKIPARVITHLEGARRIGNRGAHADEFESPDVDARDVEVALLQVLNLVEWYLFEYDNNPN
jgi:hypothetical protein